MAADSGMRAQLFSAQSQCKQSLFVSCLLLNLLAEHSDRQACLKPWLCIKVLPLEK